MTAHTHLIATLELLHDEQDRWGASTDRMLDADEFWGLVDQATVTIHVPDVGTVTATLTTMDDEELHALGLEDEG